jgi:Flp pilus assembly protein TadG
MRHRRHRATGESQDSTGERGDATVQAVALVPLTLLMIFAIVQFAVAWYAKTALTAAAEDGLRYTQTNSTQSPEPAAQQSALMNAGFVDDLTITSNRTAGGRLTVTVKGKVPGAFPGLRWTITGTATGVAEEFRPQGG